MNRALTSGTNYVALSDQHFIFQGPTNMLPFPSTLTKIYTGPESPHQEACLKKFSPTMFPRLLPTIFHLVLNYQFSNRNDREWWNCLMFKNLLK